MEDVGGLDGFVLFGEPPLTKETHMNTTNRGVLKGPSAPRRGVLSQATATSRPTTSSPTKLPGVLRGPFPSEMQSGE